MPNHREGRKRACGNCWTFFRSSLYRCQGPLKEALIHSGGLREGRLHKFHHLQPSRWSFLLLTRTGALIIERQPTPCALFGFSSWSDVATAVGGIYHSNRWF
eukprot:388253-Amphidinium_carterae.1